MAATLLAATRAAQREKRRFAARSGLTGSSPMNSSTISAARHSVSTLTPLSIPAPVSALARASPETRWKARARSGRRRRREGSAPTRAASSAAARPLHRLRPGNRGPRQGPLPSASAATEPVRPTAARARPRGRAGALGPLRIRGSFFACSTSGFVSPPRRAVDEARVARAAATIASPASRRSRCSVSGSSSRKTSIRSRPR